MSLHAFHIGEFMIEIRFHGMGGQGAVMGALMFAEAAFSEPQWSLTGEHDPYRLTKLVRPLTIFVNIRRRRLFQSGRAVMNILYYQIVM